MVKPGKLKLEAVRVFSLRDEHRITAALVKKLGGKVCLSRDEVESVAGLVIETDPDNNDIVLTSD